MTTSSSREPARARRRAGFTLYEVIIVLIVLLVIGGVVAPAFSGFLPSIRVRKTGDSLISTIEKARVDAVLTSRRFRIVFSREPAAFRLEYEPDPMNEPGTFRRVPGEWGAKNELPDGLQFATLEGGTTVAETTEDSVEFSPDGSASAMTIVVAHENGDHVKLAIDPANGRARVVEDEERP